MCLILTAVAFEILRTVCTFDGHADDSPDNLSTSVVQSFMLFSSPRMTLSSAVFDKYLIHHRMTLLHVELAMADTQSWLKLWCC